MDNSVSSTAGITLPRINIHFTEEIRGKSPTLIFLYKNFIQCETIPLSRIPVSGDSVGQW